VERRAPGRTEEAAAAVELADQLGRECEHTERPPAEGVHHPQQARDRDEQCGAEQQPFLAREPQPQGERHQGERHRQREIDEPEQQREIVGEGQGEQSGRRHPAVDLARHP
jgi:hypothetical protein